MNVRVFGSRARGDAGRNSDPDLLADFPAGTSLLDVIGFDQELEEMLGFPVKTGSEKGLHPRIKERFLAEALPLIGK